jgi:hypothetical protein
MRTSRDLILLVLILLGLRAAVEPARAGDPAADGLAPATPRMVEGYGQTEEDAIEVAEDKAVKWIKEELDRRFGKAFWMLDVDKLRDDGILSKPTLLPSRPTSLGSRFQAQIQVTLTPAFLADMRETGRSLRMPERHLVVGRVLIGVVALLLVVMGYLRLEDATRGYYTRVLRLGALAVLTLVGTGLWFLS